MERIKLAALTALAVLICACSPDLGPDNPQTPSGGDGGSTNQGSGSSSDGGFKAEEGLGWLFSGDDIPEFHLEVSLAEWNRLLGEFDKNKNTSEYIHADVLCNKGEEKIRIGDVGLRLKGNTSRRRPEGNEGMMHTAGQTGWHHCHYQLNFTKYNKDVAHELHGVKKLYLKWFKDDPMYVREVFCFDLFHRVGVWTAPHSAYCRLWIKVAEDPSETYLGVYNMIELVDGRYANARAKQFAFKDGFLWKCSSGASLSDASDHLIGNDGSDKIYELKTQTAEYAAAKAQLQDFIKKGAGKGDENFKNWILEVCDVELLLKTYAVNVAVGMWDDYWKNKNNYYIYVNSKDL